MPYITSVERIGRQEGLREGLLTAIALLLEVRFGPAGLQLLPTIAALTDVPRLQRIAAGLKTASTLDEVRQLAA